MKIQNFLEKDKIFKLENWQIVFGLIYIIIVLINYAFPNLQWEQTKEISKNLFYSITIIIICKKFKSIFFTITSIILIMLIWIDFISNQMNFPLHGIYFKIYFVLLVLTLGSFLLFIIYYQITKKDENQNKPS